MIQINTFLKRKNAHNIVVFNTVLWGFSFVLLLLLFSDDFSPSKIDYVYTTSFLITIIIPVTINLYFLIPYLLKKEKYISFILLFILNLILFTQLNIWFFNSLIEGFFSDFYFISYHSNIKIIFIFSAFFIITSLIKLTEDWFYLNQIENSSLKAEKQEIENQLSSLKAQINPHFLFNSLNVLYSLAIDKKEDITNAILQLSDILRYVIYDVEADKITLEKEIDLIKSYIAFEKNRHVKDSKIGFNYKVEEQHEIYPMLLLPIIENSFKHGLKSGIENPFVKIDLNENNKQLTFKISNNFKEKKLLVNSVYKGIGLKNIKENLALIYPKKHTFRTEIKSDVFTVILSIDLK